MATGVAAGAPRAKKSGRFVFWIEHVVHEYIVHFCGKMAQTRLPPPKRRDCKLQSSLFPVLSGNVVAPFVFSLRMLGSRWRDNYATSSDVFRNRNASHPRPLAQHPVKVSASPPQKTTAAIDPPFDAARDAIFFRALLCYVLSLFYLMLLSAGLATKDA